MYSSHKSRKLAKGKFAVGQGKHREFEIQFEWGLIFSTVKFHIKIDLDGNIFVPSTSL